MKAIIYIVIAIMLLTSVSAGFWTYVDPDLEDPSYVTISGTINDAATNNPIPDAFIEFKNPYVTVQDRTDSSGYYSASILKDTTFELLVSKSGYNPVYVIDAYSVDTTLDLELATVSSNCNSDCTRGDIDICDRTCQGYNDCHMADDAFDVCDPWIDPAKGFKFGALVYRNDGKNIVKCCSGTRQTINTEKGVDVSVSDADNVIITERIAMLRGNLVKLKIVIFK